MEVQHKEGKKGMFFMGEEERPKAEMTYTMLSSHQMIIEHTEVSNELRGQNAGYIMVTAAVEYARKNQLKIIPRCPFAASVFKKKLEYADVLQTQN
jgi:uncharacterized protein